MQVNVNSSGIDLDAIPQFEMDAMCRTIIGSVRRLFEDEAIRAEFEAWKQARRQSAKPEGIQR